MHRIKRRTFAAILTLFLLVGTVVYAEGSNEIESMTHPNPATNLNIKESEQTTTLLEKESPREEMDSAVDDTSGIPTLDVEKESTQENDMENQQEAEEMGSTQGYVTDEKEGIAELDTIEEPLLEKEIDEIPKQEPIQEEADLAQEIINTEESTEIEMDPNGKKAIQEKTLALETISEEPVIKPQGLADVKLLSSTQLTAQYTDSSIEGKKKITLHYTGNALLHLGLLEHSYIIFQIPTEMENLIETAKLNLSYDIPYISLLGLDLIRDRGHFENISINGNWIFADFGQALNLKLGSGKYYFTLEIELNTLPISPTGTYTFYADVTNQIIDLSILSNGTFAKTTLQSPQLRFEQVPEMISFQPTEIGSSHYMIPRENPEQSIQVLDTRGKGATWKLLAGISKPLTSIENSTHTLPGALVYIRENKKPYALSDVPIEVFAGVTGDNPSTSVWSVNTGPFIQLDPSNAVYAERYSTTITWTLVDAP